jgi:hypothetical protein
MPNPKDLKKAKAKKRSHDDLLRQLPKEVTQAETKRRMKGKSLLDMFVTSILEDNVAVRKSRSFGQENRDFIQEEGEEADEEEADDESDEKMIIESSSNSARNLDEMFEQFKFNKSTPTSEVRNNSQKDIKQESKVSSSIPIKMETKEEIEQDIGDMYGFKKKPSLPSTSKDNQKEESDVKKKPKELRQTYEYTYERPGRESDSFQYEDYNYWVEVYDINSKRYHLFIFL